MILSKYNEAMERLTVSEETRRRIMENIGARELTQTKVVRFPNVKKYISLAACLAVAVLGVLAVILFTSPQPQVPGDLSTGGAPVEYESAAALSKASGIKIKDLQNLPFEPAETAYLDYGINLAEIVYRSGDAALWYRVSKGSGDNSGDYNEYNEVVTEELGGVAVTMKGSGGLIYCALYEKGGRSYSLGSAEGLTREQLMQMIP
jgi:hypothetical protein